MDSVTRFDQIYMFGHFYVALGKFLLNIFMQKVRFYLMKNNVFHL